MLAVICTPSTERGALSVHVQWAVHQLSLPMSGLVGLALTATFSGVMVAVSW
jgi:hypothetical protein